MRFKLIQQKCKIIRGCLKTACDISDSRPNFIELETKNVPNGSILIGVESSEVSSKTVIIATFLLSDSDKISDA